MTDKERAIETIQRLPESATLEDIVAGLYFRQKVDRGLEDVQQGRVVSHEQAKQRLSRWLPQ
jgi:predicted transcriptional regulator